MYRNPVIRGFNPDPSVVRVGEEFYLAASSFEYFPGIPLYRSRNLVDWTPIGHVVERDSQLDLRGIDDSHGIWAPDLSYHDGKFYVYATLRLNGLAKGAPGRLIRRQMAFVADRPEGPWSDPSFIDIDGIDPSHFVDDDGRRYLLLEPGVRIVPLSDDGLRAVGEPRTIWAGTGERCPEGPHLFKKDGRYYAILAEGGTGYGHRISVARSDSLYGPYEPSPYNPVMTQSDPSAPIQRAGHGKLVRTDAGEWWCLYLCGRPNGGQFTTLGRETALDPVEWTDDGWFTINRGRGPSTENRSPATPEAASDAAPASEMALAPSGVDRFEGPRLALSWLWARNPVPGSWRLLPGGGLGLRAGNEALGSPHIENLLLRRETEFDYDASCILAFDPANKREEAGLAAYIGFANWISCCLTRRDDGSPRGREPSIRLCACVNGERRILADEPAVPAGGQADADGSLQVELRISVKGQRREFFWRPAGNSGETADEAWRAAGTVEDARFLSGEAVVVGKAHTGTLVGLYATNGGTGRRSEARISAFSYSTTRRIP